MKALSFSEFINEGFNNDADGGIDKIKKALSTYNDILQFIETSVGKKFKLGDREELIDKKGYYLPELEVFLGNTVYDKQKNEFVPNDESVWQVWLHDRTPIGRNRDKLLLSTSNVDEVIKLMNRYAKSITKNKQ